MNKHTPGPWEIANGPRVYASGKSGPLLATISYLPKATGQEMANTRLVAAAPDLLQACQSLCGVFEGIDDVPRYVIKARAAIARATGA